MSGSTDLFSVALALTSQGDVPLNGNATTGTTGSRVFSVYTANTVRFTPGSSGSNTGQTYTITALQQNGGLIRPFFFSNPVSITNNDGTTTTQVTRTSFSQPTGNLLNLASTQKFNIIAADATHILLVSPGALAGELNSAILLATDRSLNPNDPNYVLKSGSFTISDSAPAVPPVIPCFAAGTLIRTEAGDRTVESIVVGDRVIILDGSAAEVVWVGSRVVELTGSDIASVQPIRIKAGALADNQPSRDLIVSPDHAIFIDDVFVAAKMLVNGGSIVAETTMTSVNYVHVELARHAVMFAENLPAESYLDGGNRYQFDTDEGAVNFANPAALYAEKGFARLAMDVDTVRPIWSTLATRALSLGFEVSTFDASHEPDLRLVVGGREIRAARVEGSRHLFAVPAGADTIRVVSRAARPSDTQPWVSDRRRLGVAISRFSVTDANGPVGLVDGHGWWGNEGDYRWTNGDAVVAIVPAAVERMVEIDVHGTVAYPVRAAA